MKNAHKTPATPAPFAAPTRFQVGALLLDKSCGESGIVIDGFIEPATGNVLYVLLFADGTLSAQFARDLSGSPQAGGVQVDKLPAGKFRSPLQHARKSPALVRPART